MLAIKGVGGLYIKAVSVQAKPGGLRSAMWVAEYAIFSGARSDLVRESYVEMYYLYAYFSLKY